MSYVATVFVNNHWPPCDGWLPPHECLVFFYLYSPTPVDVIQSIHEYHGNRRNLDRTELNCLPSSMTRVELPMLLQAEYLKFHSSWTCDLYFVK